MSILTEAEIAVYAPDVTLTGFQLTASIAAIQMILEGPFGAQRPLEATEYNEIIDVRYKMQTAQLRYWPILDTPLPRLRVRFGNVQNQFNDPIALSDWAEIDNALELIDHTGQVNLNRANFGFQGQGVFQGATQLNAIYTSGLDFSVLTTDLEALQIKQLLGSILDFQLNDLSALGISSYAADDEGKFTLKSNTAATSSGSSGSSGKGGLPNLADPTTMINSLLTGVHKYRPRGVI